MRAQSTTPATLAALVAIATAAVAAVGCKDRGGGHDHAEAHPEGHDHHEQGHGHGAPMFGITLWSEAYELFAEHAPAMVSQETSMLAHVTILDGFQPLRRGGLRLELDGPASIRARAGAPTRDGIFRLAFTPSQPGLYRGRLVVLGPGTDDGGHSHGADDHPIDADEIESRPALGAIDGVELRVFATEREARASAPDEDDHGLIEFLKESQWRVPFATVFAEDGELAASIEVAGTVDTPPGGSAEVGAPVAGRVIAPARGLPRPGDTVKKGQVLASLAPAPSSPEDAARASLVVAEAEARAAAARAAAERAERLIRDEAISQRELEDARREASVADEAVRAARQAAALFADARAGARTGTWRLVAPIAGTLTRVTATPGASVSPGQPLFHIVDDRELWIRARVPEQDAAKLRADRDASYQIAGLDTWRPIHVSGRVSGDAAAASVVSVSRTVDPVSRTVDILYALRDPGPALRVGGRVQVSVPVGDDFRGVIIPHAAIVRDGGQELVYVQEDGEHFAERAVRTGPRSGALIGVRHGLRPGERVVTRGAHLVRLAGRADSSEAHGHIH